MTHILLADDHPIYLTGLSRLLVNEGYEIDTATNGKEALALICKLPAAAVLDIKMPEMGGLEALKAIHCQYPDINVLLLSGYVNPDMAYDAIRSGAKGYMLKSDPIENILLGLQTILRGEIILPPEIQRDLASALTTKEGTLTNREQEVLELVADGLPSAKVASLLFISVPTVKIHLNHIYKKLGVNSRAAAIHEAMRRGMLE